MNWLLQAGVINLRLLWVLVLGACMAPQLARALPAVNVGAVASRIDLSAAAELLEDPGGKLTLADVQSPAYASHFRPGSPRIGFSGSAYWMRISMAGTPVHTTWWLDSGNRTLQEIDFYAPDASGTYVRQSAGSTRAFADRPLPTPTFVFPFEIPEARTVDVFLRVRSTGYLGTVVAPEVSTPGAHLAHVNHEKGQWFYYLGLVSALGLLNLLLFFYVRDINFLRYVLSSLSIVWAVSSAEGGFGSAYEYAWPNFPNFEQASWVASILASSYFMVLFVVRFIELPQKMPRLWKLLNLSFGLLALALGFQALATLLHWQLPASVLQRLHIAGTIPYNILMGGLTYGICWLAGSGVRTARFVAVGWLPIVLGALANSVIVSAGYRMSASLLMWLSAWEVVVMSLALADRFNQERRARERAQRALIVSLQQSERELEEKVMLRTAEVKAQANEIAEWNGTLERRVDEQVDQINRLGRLKRFFSPQLAEVIVAGGEEALKTHRRNISVVFIDLRGFTAFTDQAEPEQVIEMLRSFHASMGQIVMAHGGTLERFAGDSLMVFFNDPVQMERHAEHAVGMALRMQEAFLELSAIWGKRGFVLGLGCGIAQGYATLGEIGFEGRWDYAAIGGVTNLAARLCAEASSGQVLVDQKVMREVERYVQSTSTGLLKLKGFAEPVPAFSITGLLSQVAT